MIVQPDLAQTKVLHHGGDLTNALRVYGGDHKDWLDLSTGISPWSYPIPVIDASLWQSLPTKPDNLHNAAADYYRCEKSSITTTPGSQLAIRLLPTLVGEKQTVAVPLIGYQEHLYSWQLAAHNVIHYRNLAEAHELINAKRVQNMVVINPNNPSGETIAAADLRLIASQLSGLLIVDEAFADLDSSDSLSSDSDLSNIVVLRSIGKFFGLAGARIGFVITHHPIGLKITALLEPWSINAPAQHLAKSALRDRQWQERQRLRINSQAIELNKLLDSLKKRLNLNSKQSSAGLFGTISGSQVTIRKLHIHLAENRIWTRIGDPYHCGVETNSTQNWLRLSLPGDNFDLLSNSLNRIY